VIVFVNLGLAVTVLAALHRVPPANQLAAARIEGASIRVLLGEGWFGRETHGPEVWAWSKGEAALRLRSEAKEPRQATLRFGVRALGSRTVTAKFDGQVVWQGKVGEQFEEVRIPALTISPGGALLYFETDVPGVPEAGAAGGRALTYALYNPVLEP
jgi:hypothetical protein